MSGEPARETRVRQSCIEMYVATAVSEYPRTQQRVAFMPSVEQRIAYLLLRVLVGMDFFGHGFTRIFTGTHLSGFAHWMVTDMAKAPLPPELVLLTGYVVPWVELVIGVLLPAGVATRLTLVTAGLLMVLLMFGITMKQDWNVAGLQLLYGLVLALLMFGRETLDTRWTELVRRH